MYVDPTGHSLLAIFLVCVIGGAVIGAVTEATIAGIEAAHSGADTIGIASAVAGGLFGGAFKGAIAGGVVGLGAVLIGAGGAAIGGGLFALAGGGTAGGAVLAGSASVVAGIAVARYGVLEIADILGMTVLFSKGSGSRFGHNGHEKQMWNEAMRQLGITDKDMRQRLHHLNSKKPYAETLKDLLKNLREILEKIGGSK